MDLSEVARSLQQIWQDKPVVIVLLLLGFAGFVYLVIDAWRHKRRRKRPR